MRADNPTEASRWIKQTALGIGFDKVGIARAESLPASFFIRWLKNGFHGQMDYLAGQVEKRLDPGKLIEGTRAVVSVALNYYHADPEPLPQALLSRYCWGEDYHRIVKERLQLLYSRIQDRFPETSGGYFVDSAPVMEKQWAVRCGIGWQGKNCLVITPEFGSWIFLGELLLDIELEPDNPLQRDCGTCRKCLDACPTGALVAPYQIDASRCLSYFTIENRQADLPDWVKSKLGNRIFGCDLCQSVCPINQKQAKTSKEPRFAADPRRLIMDIDAAQNWDKTQFKERYRNSPLIRAGYALFKRNLQIVRNNRNAQLRHL